MNQVLFEVSYIGCPKAFYEHVTSVLSSVIILAASVYWLKEEKSVKEKLSRSTIKEYFVNLYGRGFLTLFTIVWAIFCPLDIITTITGYYEDILGYKRGEYREVEGFVENYTEHKNGPTFTVDGVEFEASSAVSTWGYTYWKADQNVITGDGQHLRIRYTAPHVILYIEEIAEE